MICYIDIEHPPNSILGNKDRHKDLVMTNKLRYEEISGQPCLVQHYTHLKRHKNFGRRFKAMILGGTSTNWNNYDMSSFEELFKLIRDGEVPILGICGGHQLIGHAWGVPVGPIRELKAGEADPRPDYRPGYFKEWGFKAVEAISDGPLFCGLSKRFTVAEYHCMELKELPPGFVVIAANESCPIQAMKHEDGRTYGVQFHPERYNEHHTDGKTILRNFFRIAAIY